MLSFRAGKSQQVNAPLGTALNPATATSYRNASSTICVGPGILTADSNERRKGTRTRKYGGMERGSDAGAGSMHGLGNGRDARVTCVSVAAAEACCP